MFLFNLIFKQSLSVNEVGYTHFHPQAFTIHFYCNIHYRLSGFHVGLYITTLSDRPGARFKDRLLMFDLFKPSVTVLPTITLYTSMPGLVVLTRPAMI